MKCLRLLLGSLLLLGLSGVALGQGGNLSQPPTYTSLPNFAGLGVRPSLEYVAGDGIGFQDGYAKLGFFAPALQAPGDWIVFSDFRFLIDNNQNLGGNFGMGYRRYVASMDRTFGGYGYYDARQTDIDHYQQLTGGIETRGQFFDAVLNAYVPIGDDVGQRTQVTANGPITQAGNNLLAPGILTSENAMTGVDLNVFGRLPLDIDADIRPFGGAYWFTNSGEGDAVGGLVGVDAAIASMARVSVHYQNDDVFGSQVVAQFAFTFPARLRRDEPYYGNVRDTLADPVDRLDFIVLNQTFENVGVALTNPADNEPIFVVYLDEDAVGPGDGTFENPFTSLADVEQTAPENAIIFIREGEYQRADSDTLLTLRDGQRVLGEATMHMVPTVELGNIMFPEFDGGADRPVFNLDEAQIGIELEDDNEVAGIEINGNGEDDTVGIVDQSGGRSNNIVIRDNRLVDLDDEGLDFNNVGGMVTIVDNEFDNIDNEAIQIDIDDEDPTTVVIDNNEIGLADGSDATGIRIEVPETGGFNPVGNITITNNEIGEADDGDIDNGIVLRTIDDGSQLTATISGNEVTDADDDGLLVETVGESSTITFIAENNGFEDNDQGVTVRTVGEQSQIRFRFNDSDDSDGDKIDNNEIGFRVLAEGENSTISFQLNNNLIEDSVEENVLIETVADNSSIFFEAMNNEIDDADTNGFVVRTTGAGSQISFVAEGNEITDSMDGDGLLLDVVGTGSTMNAIVTNNPLGTDNDTQDFNAVNTAGVLNLQFTGNFNGGDADDDAAFVNDTGAAANFTFFDLINSTIEADIETALQGANGGMGTFTLTNEFEATTGILTAPVLDLP